MKKLVLVLFVLFAGLGVNAQTGNKNAKYDFAVNGNCDQCKKRIEKAAFSVPGVKSAVWDVDKKMAHVILNEQKSSVQTVKKAIAKAGHDTDDYKATDADYNNLHSCCLYDRN